jgi:hypothetical protein
MLTGAPLLQTVNGNFHAATPVCFDGGEEILLQGAALPSGDCTKIVSMNTPPGPAANRVYIVTGFAASPVTGAHRILQSELALAPAPPFPYGMYATSTGYGAVTLGGAAAQNTNVRSETGKLVSAGVENGD